MAPDWFETREDLISFRGLTVWERLLRLIPSKRAKQEADLKAHFRRMQLDYQWSAAEVALFGSGDRIARFEQQIRAARGE
jgi:hypothetical protein